VGIDDKVATGRGRRFVIAGRLRTLILVGALFQSGHRRRVRLSPWTPVTRRPATGAEASSVEGVRVSEPISAARGGGCVGLRRHLMTRVACAVGGDRPSTFTCMSRSAS